MTHATLVSAAIAQGPLALLAVPAWLENLSLGSLFLYVFVICGALAAAVVGVAVIVKYGAAMLAVLVHKKSEPAVITGPEPAYRQYFYRQAFIDYRAVVRTTISTSREMLKSISRLSNTVNSGCVYAGNGIMMGTLAAIVVGGLILALVGAVHLLVVVVICAGAMALAALCRVLEYGAMLWRRAFLVCPHTGCYRRIALPVYLCPGCGARHKRLIPGSYGTFRRRCQCGQQLPTLFWGGKHRLPSHCPHPRCGGPLHRDMGQVRNLHIPIIGGASAGKTSLLAAMMVELSARAAQARLKLGFPEPKDERTFAAARDAFSRGQLVGKTAAYAPTAFQATVTDARRHGALLYVYDAAGELYQGAAELHGHEYYAYIHGLLLVIDPYSLPEARQEGGAAFFRIQHAVRPSSEPPEAVYGRMVEALRGFSGKAGPLDRPLAVVLTKADALGLAGKLDGPAGAVRRWLAEHGEGNLVRTIERDFKDVRYFACSALGRVPGQGAGGFTPAGVLAPLGWLLAHYGIKLEEAEQTAARPAGGTA